jgi:UV radiation resistance-associated gene protein
VRSCSLPISPLSLDAESAVSRTITHSGFPVSRKSTPFLSPLAAILRSRYPSSAGRPTVRVVDEAPEPAADDETIETDAEQATDAETVDESLPLADKVETKSTVRSNALAYTPSTSNGNGRPFEKLVNVDEPPTPPPPLPGVT